MKKLLLFIAFVFIIQLSFSQTWGIVGSATQNGWGGPDISMNYNVDLDIWEATVELTDGLIKFRANNDFNVGDYGDFEADGTLEAPPYALDIPVTAGTYKIVMDLNNLTYSITPYIPILGVAGDATPGWWDGPDLELSFDENTKLWTGNLSLTDGEIKFRFENSWDVNFGGELGNATYNGILVSGGANIPVVAGDYFVKVDLNAMTYSLEDPYVSIPDENFEAYLETHTANGDEVLLGDPASMGDGVMNHLTLKSKVENVTDLRVNYLNIASLIGIEAFSSLEIFWCQGNQLTSLDVTKNLALTNLECQTNQFSNLDLSQNVNLKVIGCANNNLSELDVSQNLLLEAIWCTDNNISGLNLEVNTKLKVYGLFNNPLTSLSIKNGNNRNIQYSDMHSFTFDGTTPSLSCITVDSESADNSNLNLDPNVTISNNCSGIVNIPDPIFEQALIDLGFDTNVEPNGEISQVDAENIYSIDINNKGINDVSGIEYFVNLEKLFCNNNNLTKLQLRNHPNLNEIRVNNNSLNTINVNNCPSLDILYCQYNQLQELDVTNNAVLSVLECEGNGLEELNVTQNPLLRVLGFGPNNLTEIDVSQNLALEAIWTNRNYLTTLNLDANSALAVIGLSGNPLTYVSLKNGNNEHVVYFEANSTDNLACINADPVVSQSMSNSGKTFSEDCSTTILTGKWIIAPETGAIKLGPVEEPDRWWYLNKFGDDIAARACYMDDVYDFGADGSFMNILGLETWLEPFQGVTDEQCGTPVAPHDGSANASYVYDQVSGTITLNGKGAYLGLPKVINGVVLSDPNDAPNSIIYDVLFSENGNVMTLSISLGSGFWTFKFVKEPVITLDDVIAIDCFGNNNGAINISVSGGAAPVTFTWTKNGDPEFNSANEDQTDLTPGSYNLLFTDVYGLTSQLNNVIITEPPLLTASITNNSTSCSNNATVTTYGGAPDYTYLWSNGATSASIENVPVGTYDVTVTDANLCSTTTSIALTVGEAFNPSASVTDVSCFGDSNGIIEVTNANGTAPFEFSKDGITFSEPGEFPYSFNDLEAGTYEIAVRDANGCTGFVTKTVSQPEELTVTLVSIQSTCSGESTGSISVETAGGTGGLSYSWEGPEAYASSQRNISGLAVGEYSLTVTDNNGCKALLDAVVPTSNEIVVSETITNVLCKGTLTGSIDLAISGGSGSGFTYSWTGNITSTSEDISNLGSGTNYNVTITDIGSGCTVSESYIVTEPAVNLSLATSKINADGCKGGTIIATASGGTSPYEYKLDNGNYQSSGEFTSLSSGSFTVWVKDSSGCTSSKVVAITDNGKDKWETNNSKNRAILISTGTTINARIALANDTADWFKFTTPEGGGNYTVNFYHPSASFNVQLYPDSRNAAALAPTSPSSNQYALTGNATYYVQITGGLSFDCYDLSIFPVTSAARSTSTKTDVMSFDEFSVKAWPNPSDSSFNIKLKSINGLDKVDINVFDVTNKLVHSNQFEPNQEYRFGGNLEGGIYFVKLSQADNVQSVKLVKY